MPRIGSARHGDVASSRAPKIIRVPQFVTADLLAILALVSPEFILRLAEPLPTMWKVGVQKANLPQLSLWESMIPALQPFKGAAHCPAPLLCHSAAIGPAH